MSAEGAVALEPKQIIKEGLSEYFIFAIEGTETIPNGWSKRMRSIEAESVPFKVQYRYRAQEYGDQLVRMYLLTNDKDSKLGTSPLPDGVVRLFRDNGHGGLSYLVAQTVKYIPIGDKIELNLGQDPNVLFDLVKLKFARDNIWMQINGADVLQAGRPAGRCHPAQFLPSSGGTITTRLQSRVRNFSGVPIEVEGVRLSFAGHVLFRSSLKPTLFDYHTVQFTASVPAGKKADLLFESVLHEGRNSKQNNVTLEDAVITP